MEDFGTFTDEQIARFWSRVDKRGEDECWPWVGPTRSSGYGNLGWRTTRGVSVQTASRAATWIAHGPPPMLGRLLHSRHICDNKACVNPKHLTWGTPLQNVHDTQRALKRAGRVKTYEEREAKRRFVESDATRPTMLDGMANYYTALESMDVGVDRPARPLLRHLRAWETLDSQQGRAESLARLIERAVSLGVHGGRGYMDESRLAGCSLFNDKMPTTELVPTMHKTSYAKRCGVRLRFHGMSRHFPAKAAIFGTMIVVTAELLEACARCQETSILVLASGAAES